MQDLLDEVNGLLGRTSRPREVRERPQRPQPEVSLRERIESEPPPAPRPQVESRLGREFREHLDRLAGEASSIGRWMDQLANYAEDAEPLAEDNPWRNRDALGEMRKMVGRAKGVLKRIEGGLDELGALIGEEQPRVEVQLEDRDDRTEPEQHQFVNESVPEPLRELLPEKPQTPTEMPGGSVDDAVAEMMDFAAKEPIEGETPAPQTQGEAPAPGQYVQRVVGGRLVTERVGQDGGFQNSEPLPQAETPAAPAKVDFAESDRPTPSDDQVKSFLVDSLLSGDEGDDDGPTPSGSIMDQIGLPDEAGSLKLSRPPDKTPTVEQIADPTGQPTVQGTPQPTQPTFVGSGNPGKAVEDAISEMAGMDMSQTVMPPDPSMTKE